MQFDRPWRLGRNGVFIGLESVRNRTVGVEWVFCGELGGVPGLITGAPSCSFHLAPIRQRLNGSSQIQAQRKHHKALEPLHRALAVVVARHLG